MRGNIWRGIFMISRISSSHSRVRRSMSMVRPALVTSVI